MKKILDLTEVAVDKVKADPQCSEESTRPRYRQRIGKEYRLTASAG